MTHIIGFKTKKAFKEAVALKGADFISVDDPSMFNPCSGTVAEVAKKLGHFTVTNHPKRSWFAAVTLKDGKIKIE